MEMHVLVLNSGSSTLKFQLISTGIEETTNGKQERLCRGQIEGIGGEAIIAVQTRKGQKEKFAEPLADISASLDYLLRWITSAASGITEVGRVTDIDAVGHRVVHGGERFVRSVMITDDVLRGIEECIDLAPVHNPNNLKGILAAKKIFGSRVPQVAVFDTSFHHSIPEHAYLYALPYHYYECLRIRRYGFHGISHRYVTERYGKLLNLTSEQTHIITLHLGNGCSVSAIQNGCSVDTSMGMTPLEGLVMGTRCGDIDPAVLNLIAAKEGFSAHDVEVVLNTQSGLLGVSGLTNDMRVLLKTMRDQGDNRARLAIEIFCYRARKYIGAYLACMEGADAIVFTGGIGENSPEIRRRICEGLKWAGLCLDEALNQQMVGLEGRISNDASRLHAYVIPTDEEMLIALDTVGCILGEVRTAPPERHAKAEEAAIGSQ